MRKKTVNVLRLNKRNLVDFKGYICFILEKFYDNKNDVEVLSERLFGANCYINKIELHTEKDGSIIGFNSFCVYKVKIDNKEVYISRPASFILKDHRGKLTSAKFILKQILWCNFKKLFLFKKHYFIYIASGFGSFYLVYKFNDNKYLYPFIDGRRDVVIEGFLKKVFIYFNYIVTSENPIKVRDPYIVERDLSSYKLPNPIWKRKILDYYYQHTVDNESSIACLMNCSWSMILKTLIGFFHKKLFFKK